MNICLLSGGFDPIHIGHVRMIRAASLYGEVLVGLNSDEWLVRKKGKPFMKYDERREILENIVGVAAVISFDDSNDTACELIRGINKIHRFSCTNYDKMYFGNGGDRNQENVPEREVCKELGVEMIWGLGGGKIQSSSLLHKRCD